MTSLQRFTSSRICFATPGSRTVIVSKKTLADAFVRLCENVGLDLELNMDRCGGDAIVGNEWMKSMRSSICMKVFLYIEFKQPIGCLFRV